MSQLKEFYEKEAVPKLIKAFDYKNIMEVPRLQKVVLNMGLGEAIQNIKLLDSAAEELKIIAGQKPVITRAKKSIAAFKLREGMPIGCMVTLRRNRMYDFYYKLVNIALPRVRDFRGISGKAFDGRGNYSLGLKEHMIFDLKKLVFSLISIDSGHKHKQSLVFDKRFQIFKAKLSND